ncbi:hypothetical protein [Bacillus atrophaeus]|uniref:hypothetical protein n=1 Tax=Bacillus atrophaeus TaxID=1452 RepID=UPI000D030AC7|nr:hypothetical protein [Bacillus atrophaeus]MCY9204308.1 hypothetical protein [Bacillus atrophaeus]MEC0885250.1 hypothetical protein [Bacillus atrophaeus]PRR87700.1 hypothetical protein C6W23_17120 [Bacillus atrophaeus]
MHLSRVIKEQKLNLYSQYRIILCFLLLSVLISILSYISLSHFNKDLTAYQFSQIIQNKFTLFYALLPVSFLCLLCFQNYSIVQIFAFGKRTFVVYHYIGIIFFTQIIIWLGYVLGIIIISLVIDNNITLNSSQIVYLFWLSISILATQLMFSFIAAVTQEIFENKLVSIIITYLILALEFVLSNFNIPSVFISVEGSDFSYLSIIFEILIQISVIIFFLGLLMIIVLRKDFK